MNSLTLIHSPPFDLDAYAELTREFGTPYNASTVAPREQAHDAFIYRVPQEEVGLHLHAESTYNPDTPDYVAIMCEEPPAAPTLLLNGATLLRSLSSDLRKAWEDCWITWEWPYKHSERAVKDGYFSNTVLSCYDYSNYVPLVSALPKLSSVTPEQVLQTLIDSKLAAHPYPWGPNEILILDNSKWLHGRLPGKGERKLYVQTISEGNPIH